jgi:hypothetical protein
MDELGPVLFVIVIAAFAGLSIRAARRFAEKKRREGLWDEKGPIDPSLPPTDFLQVYPRPWGIQRPEIVSEDAANPYKYPQGKDDIDSPEHDERLD